MQNQDVLELLAACVERCGAAGGAGRGAALLDAFESGSVILCNA